MDKLTLFMFDAHFASGNIASARFNGLLKYLNRDSVDVHVFTSEKHGQTATDYDGDRRKNFVVHQVKGVVLGAETKPIHSLTILVQALGLLRRPVFNSSAIWLFNALAEAREVIAYRAAAGNDASRIICIGTYSPIDAHIAAVTMGKHLGAPVVLDYRDGFAFENIGRAGSIARHLRAVIERRLVSSASAVTTVTQPLVDHFQKFYPDKKVRLLANGFDPEEDGELSDSRELSLIREIEVIQKRGKRVVAHLGRIGGSDATRLASLQHFVSALNSYPSNDSIACLFVGNLSKADRLIIDGLKSEVVFFEQVGRVAAFKAGCAADALLLVAGSGTAVATGKLFEYLRTTKPVLGFSRVRNEAATIIEEARIGVFYTPETTIPDTWLDDALAINGGDQSVIGRYDRALQARQLKKLLEQLAR